MTGASKHGGEAREAVRRRTDGQSGFGAIARSPHRHRSHAGRTRSEIEVDPTQSSPDMMAVFAAMATPAVLLLANAMLILSTNQRLQAVLQRLRESEEMLLGPIEAESAEAAEHELEAQGRRARLAHRALLALYAASTLLLIMIGALGSSALGLESFHGIALGAAFGGAGLLLVGVGLLAGETWIGVGALDARIRRLLHDCRRHSADSGSLDSGP